MSVDISNWCTDTKLSRIYVKGAPSDLTPFLAAGSLFKNDEKCFLFHLESPSSSQDI